jgi:hypothetical protein
MFNFIWLGFEEATHILFSPVGFFNADMDQDVLQAKAASLAKSQEFLNVMNGLVSI